ncbi:MAG: DUF2569 domain-containing protein [Magnetovibrio sp.]|nr:DUF2569 domain-containing protein [Magnetovibrio sp.]
MAWTKVSDGVAQAYTFYGLRGWLLFFYVIVTAGFVMACVSITSLLISGAPLFSEGEGGSIYLSLAYIVLTFPFLVLVRTYNSKMPHAATAMIAGNYVFSVIDVFYRSGWQWTSWQNLAIPFIGSALLVWYFWSSKRVNATYRRRVPEEYAEWAETGIPYKGFVIPHNQEIYWFRGKEFATLEALHQHIDKIVK